MAGISLQEAAVLQNLANRTRQTKLGQRALAQPDGLVFLKEKPAPRFYAGLALMVLSYLVSLPALALCGYLAARLAEPWIALAGVPAVFIAVHLLFVLGAYLAGSNYARNAFLWATKRFVQKYAGNDPNIGTAS
jgi:hypothetical protein